MKDNKQQGKVYVADFENKVLVEKLSETAIKFFENAIPKQYPATWLTEEMDGREFVDGIDFVLQPQMTTYKKEVWYDCHEDAYNNTVDESRRIISKPQSQDEPKTSFIPEIEVLEDKAQGSEEEAIGDLKDKFRRADLGNQLKTKFSVLEILGAISLAYYRGKQHPDASPLPSSIPTDPFIEKHLEIIKQKTKDALIDQHIGKMWGDLSSASIKYFLETGTINGGFREHLLNLMDAWKKYKLDEPDSSIPTEVQKEEAQQSAEEFAEGMMGLGKFDPKKWHHADAMLYNTIVKSVNYGAKIKSGEFENIRQALKDISLYNNGFIEYFRRHDYRLMYELWERVYGIATAYPVSSAPPISKEDEIDIIDGYTQLAIDRKSLPKDGQRVKFMTENEDWHEGYFVGGDDIFHVTDSKFYLKWHVQQWKGI